VPLNFSETNLLNFAAQPVYDLVVIITISCVVLLNLQYEEGEEVVLYVNKVGPYNNPQETYEFYSRIPLCPPDNIEEGRLEGLGEALQGYELVKSGIKIAFKGSKRGY
jgi:transmembrane 9 superfamily protein 3